MTPQSKGLIGLFQGQTECKKNKYGEPKTAIKLVQTKLLLIKINIKIKNYRFYIKRPNFSLY